MNEEEWQTSVDPMVMLKFLCDKNQYRKVRLFAVACSRRVVHWMSDERSRNALDISEQYADRHVSRKALSAARREAFAASKAAEPSRLTAYVWSETSHAAVVALNTCADHQRTEARESLLATAGCAASLIGHTSLEATKTEVMIQCGLLREVFGNPFRPVAVDPAWLTSDVQLLAAGIYNDRAFDRMPILADALQDAGCDNDDILNHLRDATATHVRGCWALDLILGKE